MSAYVEHEYILNFEPTHTGTINRKIFKVQHNFREEDYVIGICDHNFEKVKVFTVHKKSNKIVNNELELLIDYCPILPHQTDILLIKLSAGNDLIVSVRGTSTAPSVTSSCKKVLFYRTELKKNTKLTFELYNHTDTNAYYQFDYDNTQRIFEIEPLAGQVLPKHHVFITVKFITEKVEVFFTKVVCLILFHDPIFIEICGINFENNNDIGLNLLKLQNVHLPKMFGNTYEQYFEERIAETALNSIFGLSNFYLDFGSQFSETFRNSLATTFINYTDDCMKVTWTAETRGNFSISPVEICVGPGEKIYFICTFHPFPEDQIFATTFYGNLILCKKSTSESHESKLLYPISLKVFGNSSTKKVLWLSQIEIFPRNILMPVSVQNVEVYTSFMIKRRGTFPVKFQFLFPSKTNFEIKPMQGVIFGDFQIFAVKFSANLCKTYKEIWKIQLNDNEGDQVEFVLMGIVQEPKVLIGERNEINFGNIFIGAESSLTLPIQNLTALNVKYNFFNTDCVQLKNRTGILSAYEKSHLMFCYKAKLKSSKPTDIIFELSFVQNNKLEIGETKQFKCLVYAECSYIKLCALPSSYDLEAVLCGERKNMSFFILNYGECEINFLLKPDVKFGCDEGKNIEIKPARAKVLPRNEMEINISALINSPGIGTVDIKYFVMKSASSDELVDDSDDSLQNNVLFTINWCAYYPTLKIMDILKNQSGPLFSKAIIWNLLQIDSLNGILCHVKENETKCLSVRVPYAEFGIGIKKEVIFQISNTTKWDTKFLLKRIKVCDCELEELHDSLSRRKYAYKNCPHRKIIDFNISDHIIKAESAEYLTITANYILPHINEAKYEIELSHNRKIVLTFYISGLYSKTITTLAPTLTLKLSKFLINALDNGNYLYWFYNNTAHCAYYRLDTTKLEVLSEIFGFTVLKCTNSEGIVPAKSMYPLLFKFLPIRDDKLELELPLFLDKKCHRFQIEASTNPCYGREIKPVFPFEDPRWNYWAGISVRMSTQCIKIVAAETYTYKSRLLFLRNMSKTQNYAFWFHKYTLPNIITVDVEPSTGILEPGECKLLQIICFCKNPCICLQVHCTCSLLDVTALEAHIVSRQNIHKLINSDDEAVEGSLTVLPPPKIYHEHFTVTVNMFSLKDINWRLPLSIQLYQKPFLHFRKSNSRIINEFIENEEKYIRSENKKYHETFEYHSFVNEYFETPNKELASSFVTTFTEEDKLSCSDDNKSSKLVDNTSNTNAILLKLTDSDKPFNLRSFDAGMGNHIANIMNTGNHDKLKIEETLQHRAKTIPKETTLTVKILENIPKSLSKFGCKRGVKDCKEIYVSTANYEPVKENLKRNQMNVAGIILQNLLWDVTKSVRLSHLTKIQQKRSMNYQYANYKFEDNVQEESECRNLLNIYLNRIPNKFISYTLELLLQDSLMRIYKVAPPLEISKKNYVNGHPKDCFLGKSVILSELYPEKFAFLLNSLNNH